MDVGLCLRNLPIDESFEFILEKDKLEKIKKVVNHNGGEVIQEIPMGEDVRLKVRKLGAKDGS